MFYSQLIAWKKIDRGLVFQTGLETTNFFTKPFEKEFKQLPEDLVVAYGLTVDKLLKLSLA